MRDYYHILGVSRSATIADIKKAFRTAATQTHPDKEGGNEAAFKEVYEAYDTLKDSERRKKYDEYLGSRTHSQQSRTHSSSDDSKATQSSAVANQDYKKQEQRRRQSFMYRLRYSIAFVFYLFDRLFHGINLFFSFIFKVMGHIFYIGYALCFIALYSGIAWAVLSPFPILKIIPDDMNNSFTHIITALATGGSIAMGIVISTYQDWYRDFVFKKQIPKRAVDVIFSGLIGGALITLSSYIFGWEPLGMNLVAVYAAGFAVGGVIRLLYNWSRGVDATFHK